jgi:hypothetical protein
MCLTEIYAQMHELNQAFLPRDKQIRVYGLPKPNEDPYRKWAPTASGPFPVRLQRERDEHEQGSHAGLAEQADERPPAAADGPDGHRAAGQRLRACARRREGAGQDVDKYITPPTPESNLPKMFAEEVVSMISPGTCRKCRPAEPTMEHLKKLMDFAGSDDFGSSRRPGPDLQGLPRAAAAAHPGGDAEAADDRRPRRQSSQIGAAGRAWAGRLGRSITGMHEAPLQDNELRDESLPGAGGGGNPDAAMNGKPHRRPALGPLPLLP